MKPFRETNTKVSQKVKRCEWVSLHACRVANILSCCSCFHNWPELASHTNRRHPWHLPPLAHTRCLPPEKQTSTWVGPTCFSSLRLDRRSTTATCIPRAVRMRQHTLVGNSQQKFHSSSPLRAHSCVFFFHNIFAAEMKVEFTVVEAVLKHQR